MAPRGQRPTGSGLDGRQRPPTYRNCSTRSKIRHRSRIRPGPAGPGQTGANKVPALPFGRTKPALQFPAPIRVGRRAHPRVRRRLPCPAGRKRFSRLLFETRRFLALLGEEAFPSSKLERRDSRLAPWDSPRAFPFFAFTLQRNSPTWCFSRSVCGAEKGESRETFRPVFSCRKPCLG